MLEQKYFSIRVDIWEDELKVQISLDGVIERTNLFARIKRGVLADILDENGKVRKKTARDDKIDGLMRTITPILDELSSQNWEVVQVWGPQRPEFDEHKQITWSFLARRNVSQ